MGEPLKKKYFIDWKPVTDHWGIGSEVTHISLNYHQEHRNEIYPTSEIVSVDETGCDSIDYLGYIEVKLSFPIGIKCCNQYSLFFLPTTEYHKRVPIFIGTSITFSYRPEEAMMLAMVRAYLCFNIFSL